MPRPTQCLEVRLPRRALDNLNERSRAKRRALEPAFLKDGRAVLNADLLNDCQEKGSTWFEYKAWLNNLPVITVGPDEWPDPEPAKPEGDPA